MGRRRLNLFVLLFVVGLVFASAVVIATKQTRLGLDLQGGIELTLQGRPTPQQPEVTGEAVDRAVEIIRDGCDRLGVAEIEVSRLGSDQISVGIPGATSLGKATQCATRAARLYFYDWEPNVVRNPDARPGEPGSGPEAPYTDLFEAVEFASSLKPECEDCTVGPRFYLFDRQTREFIAGPETAREDLFVSLDGEPRPRNGIVREVPQGTLVLSDTPGADPICQDDQCYFVIKDKPALSGDEIKDPKQEFDQFNLPNVTFSFTDKGREAFHDVTRGIAQRGQRNFIPGSGPTSQFSGHFAAVLDNEVVSRPIIDFGENPDGIDGRTGAQISGSFDINDAQDLAEFLKRGALPIDLKLISQSQVSATLGEEALNQGLKAAIVGLFLVICFLLIFYRFLGFVATLGLAVFGVAFYAMVELIPITLTLPGMAGLILTIGVAADANVVIFERVKEEVRAGRSPSAAIAIGYRRGIATIIDANVITLFTAFMLFVLATSSVRGFAFTLGVGTIVSLLTAVVFTQAFLGIFGRGRLMSSPRLLGAGEQRVSWRFDFMGMSKYFFSLSGLILTIGALALAVNQLNFGIDFESGTRIQVSLEQEGLSEEDVRTALSEQSIGNAQIKSIDNPALGANAFLIESSTLEPDQIGAVQTALDREFGVTPEGFDNTSIGPTFGAQIARSAALAIVFSLLIISAYVAFRFEPKYAVPVLIAVAHDILITAGVYSLSEREVTSATVAAFLTILGYSLYDTVIVFDRIRENVPRMPRATFSQIVNRSMSEVLTRSLITGLSSVFLVGVLLVFGGDTLKDFAFAMMIGIFSGTYSSIFIASPVLTAWKEREPVYVSRRLRIEEALGRVPPFMEEVPVAKLRDAELGDQEVAHHETRSQRRQARQALPVAEQIEAPQVAAEDDLVADLDVDGGGELGEPAVAEPEATATPQDDAGPSGPSKSERKRQRQRQQQRRRKHGRNR